MEGNWLDPTEQEELCEELLHYELIKISNKRDLPLKGGGKTDIYITIRDARNYPEAIGMIANYYANPLGRLNPDRFVEIPDSVSCFAGSLAMMTGIPYITIREQAKEGRVSKAKYIGSSRRGERVCIIDDVITDGASKIEPIEECIQMGLDPETLVVLVDRQQEWEQLGLYPEVWAGMTLHDVRRHLIRWGVMERCSPAIEEKNPLIVALDGKSWMEILPVIERLRTTGSILKVNDLLFEKGIEWLLPNLSVYGRVMADLKCHDIPTTVKNTCERLLKNPPWAVTIHASGGRGMVNAAVTALADVETKVLAVTVLTSINPLTCEEIYTRRPLDQVRALAWIAASEGAHGFVCSPEEAPELREAYPGKLIVTPGVRSDTAPKDDQARIATPRGARDNGADYLVMGRQILGASDPIAEVNRILNVELGIS
jgi:orotidine-5'-phosphate decarboxylase